MSRCLMILMDLLGVYGCHKLHKLLRWQSLRQIPHQRLVKSSADPVYKQGIDEGVKPECLNWVPPWPERSWGPSSALLDLQEKYHRSEDRRTPASWQECVHTPILMCILEYRIKTKSGWKHQAAHKNVSAHLSQINLLSNKKVHKLRLKHLPNNTILYVHRKIMWVCVMWRDLVNSIYM